MITRGTADGITFGSFRQNLRLAQQARTLQANADAISIPIANNIPALADVKVR